jgi:hypothetical protein
VTDLLGKAGAGAGAESHSFSRPSDVVAMGSLRRGLFPVRRLEVHAGHAGWIW